MITLHDITQIVADHYRIHPLDLMGPSRDPAFAMPRYMAYSLSRKHTRATHAQIGAHYGYRDHSAVAHGVRSIGQRLIGDADLIMDHYVMDHACEFTNRLIFTSERKAA